MCKSLIASLSSKQAKLPSTSNPVVKEFIFLVAKYLDKMSCCNTTETLIPTSENVIVNLGRSGIVLSIEKAKSLFESMVKKSTACWCVSHSKTTRLFPFSGKTVSDFHLIEFKLIGVIIKQLENVSNEKMCRTIRGYKFCQP